MGVCICMFPSTLCVNLVLITSPDEFSREPSSFRPSMDGDEQPIEPISDIGLDRINDVMFNNVNS
jgi:hypothetical protein